MTLKEELARLRAQMNEERDARERDGTSGGPSLPLRMVGNVGRHSDDRGWYPTRNMRLKGAKHQS